MLIKPRYDGPPIISIDGVSNDTGAPLARQRRRLQAMLATLTDEQWRAPSRCDGWTVQDVVAHLVGVNGFWQMSIAAGLGGEPTRILAGFDPAATPPLMVEGMRALSPAETLEQFATSNGGLIGVLDALDDTTWVTVAESPPGFVPIRLLAQHALWDSWIHERDIAIPLDLPMECEADEIEICLRYAAAISPALALTMGGAPQGTFGVVATDPSVEFTIEIADSVAVRSGATEGAATLLGDACDLVEALSIRAPLPVGAPPAWASLVQGLATAFDTIV